MKTLLLASNRHLLPDTATAGARAFTYDSLFLWLRPHPDLSPTAPDVPAPSPPAYIEATPWFRHLRLYFLFRLRAACVKPGSRTFVAVSEPSDPFWSGKEEVLGYATWARAFGGESRVDSGKAEVSEEVRRQREEVWGRDCFPDRVERYLVEKQRWWWDWMKEDRWTDRERQSEFNGAWDRFYPFTEKVLNELGKGGVEAGKAEGSAKGEGLGSGDGYVWLAFLGVDPRFQRRGVGGKLMEWGMERARLERVPAGLTGSPQGLGLYRKWGFEDVGENIEYGGMEDIFMVAWVKDEDS